ncbi:DNA-binding MarR family transcriptional regulator [Motilibacter peucedani]|uniref:DNA-binding MarR family transcriptional regulator n=1 Tax=Motilibacter peucedani TaxID=598650 RepID=A0A420XRK2_9ACTN|nr:MarR family winged helix-turn-helix transcriptional regulator [Motilibacter peucedani]RKS77508.1 DNA-binding MarR family transcriptional regulator [Motilibacter peucedani]
MLRLPHYPPNREEAAAIPEHAAHEQPTDAELADAFWSVSKTLRRQSMVGLAAWDLSPSHARALRAIASGDPVRLSALAERLRIAARSATEVVDTLAERGLAERRTDPADRRATLVALTDAGRELQEAMRAARAEEAGRLFGRLPEADRAELLRILRTLHA